MMTDLEKAAQTQIINQLNKEGYPSYAKLFALFDLNLTDDPNVVGYMVPNKAKITINQNLDIDQVSVVVRHEILHEYLSHQLRMEKKFGKDVWAKRTNRMHNDSNIAGDYEISNLGYTDKDKSIMRHIILNGNILQGLVTEDDHPGWVNKSFEEMYDLLEKQKEQEQQTMQLSPSLEDLIDAIDQALDGIENQQQNNSNNDKRDDANNQQSSNSKDDQSGTSASKTNKDDLGKNSKSPSTSNNSTSDQKLDKAEKDAENIKDYIEGEIDKNKEDGTPIPTKKEATINKKLADRIEKIKKVLDELSKNKSFIKEVEIKKQAERDARAQKEIERYKKSSTYKFRLSLANYLKNTTAVGRERSWKHFDKATVNTGIIRRGRSRVEDKEIPLFNVYFDQSGSWDAADIEEGKKMISILNDYVRRNEIKVQLYYFSDNVHTTAAAAKKEGGTEGTPIINHIIKTKPQNVIIITDSDIDDVKIQVTISGGAWFLFRNNVSYNIYDAIEAKMGKQKFLF